MKTKLIAVFIISLPLLLPSATDASCDATGETVVYINGILTSLVDAQDDLFKLNNEFLKGTSNNTVKFINGYNESHIGGLGDLVESASQLLGSPISDNDFKDILLDIRSKITTRKILLVGHSQGTFYANEIYDYLINNGEQKESVGVYNIATPADFVAGGGKYLTSINDKVINSVRDIAPNEKQPLPANINIVPTQKEISNKYGGHSFSGVYLGNASGRIISEINDSLKKLSIQATSNGNNEYCFNPPAKDVSYYAQKTFLVIGDTASNSINAINNTITATGKGAYNNIANAANLMGKTAANVYTSVESMSANIFAHGLALVGGTAGTSENKQDVPQENGSVLANNDSQDNPSESDSPDSTNLSVVSLSDENSVPQSNLNTEIDNEIPSETSTLPDINAPNTDISSFNATDSEPIIINNGGGGGGAPPAIGGSGPVYVPPTDNAQNDDNDDIDISQSNAISSQNENSTSSTSSASSTPDIPNSTSTNSTSTDSSSSSTEISSPILISEILFNPAGNDEGKEFIELYNAGETDFDMSDWALKYKKENATDTVSIAHFNTSSHTGDKTLIKAKSFFLVGLNTYDSANYGGKEADVTRAESLLNGESGGLAENVEIILYDASSSEIDSISYNKNSISGDGQSLERKSLSDGICVSAQASSTAGEFLGNGCDTGDINDFEIRSSPNPQNSDSLPEPRIAPEVNNFQVSYSFAPHFDFSWDLSTDYAGATSTLSYFIYDESNPSSTVAVLESTPPASDTPASAEYTINEVGRDYNFKFAVKDQDGLGNVATATISASSFLDKFYFYQATSTSGSGYFFDLTVTSSRPFWDNTNSSDSAGWKAIVFYLNKDAPKEGELSTDNQLIPSDDSYVRIGYDGCGGGSGNNAELIFPLNSASCIPGPLSAGAYNFSKLEDSRLVIAISGTNPVASFSPEDYVTLAFYDFGGGGGGSQRFTLAAVDKTKYYFRDAPQNQGAPTMPQNLIVNYNAGSGKLNLSWSSSTDQDTPDYLISYQVNYSTSSELSESDWQSVGSLLATSTVPVYPNSYKIGVRAVDNFNNTSTAAVADWNFPDGFVQMPSQTDRSDFVGGIGGSQKFFNQSTSTIKGVALWGASDGTGYSTSESFVQIRKDNNDRMNGETIGTSAPKILIINAAPGEIAYTFDAPIQLEASSSYWIVTFDGPDLPTGGTSYYGTVSDSYPDGYWSVRPAYDIYFRFIQ